MNDTVSNYLLIKSDYAWWLGQVRWSYTGDVVEYEDGATFAFSAEIACFLEGFAAVRSPIHFGYVLHLFQILGYGRQKHSANALYEAFQETGRLARNAGALCGHLCRSVPPYPEAVKMAEVCRRLSAGSMVPVLYMGMVATHGHDSGESAPLEPLEFEQIVLGTLAKYQPEELRHWLRHGHGPQTQAAEELAQQADQASPRSLQGILAELAQSPRLRGALPLVAQLESALLLPPRQLLELERPSGGYADVTTHGQPERLLPSQFALDDLEFLRRFAENELLYFRREEPQGQPKDELVILLDQGVRTWGIVRNVLSAAALALGKRAARKKVPLRIAATSFGGRILDPLQENDDTLLTLCEASDLSPHPGLALERVLEETRGVARDVILLTHPRSLAEPDVLAAARRAVVTDRLFALSTDADGRAQDCFDFR